MARSVPKNAFENFAISLIFYPRFVSLYCDSKFELEMNDLNIIVECQINIIYEEK